MQHLHCSVVRWEGPLVKRGASRRNTVLKSRQKKKERLMNSWFVVITKLLHCGSVHFNQTEVKTVSTRVCRVILLAQVHTSGVPLLTGSRQEVRGQIELLSSVEENTVLAPRRSLFSYPRKQGRVRGTTTRSSTRALYCC